MKYPTFPESVASDLIARLLGGEQIEDSALDGASVWMETPSLEQAIDIGALRDAVSRIRALVEAPVSQPIWRDHDRVEGRLAEETMPILATLPIEVLDDRGFWRFLSIAIFWWFVAWREEAAIVRGNISTYTDARKSTEQIPLRLFLRARSVAGGDSHDLASVLPRAADFWRSHVLRTQTCSAPSIARSLVQMQEMHGLSTTDIRPLARRLNRVWTNTLLFIYSEDEAAILVEQLRVQGMSDVSAAESDSDD